MQCSSCGSDLEPGQPACDFCGTAYGALGEGAGAQVPLQHRLGHWQKCRDVLSAKSDKSGLERSLLVDAEICLRDSAGGVLTLSCVPRALGGMAEETNEEFPYGRCP